jgi:hypothetical protein
VSLSEIIQGLLIFGIGSGLLTYLARSFFQQWLSKDVEKFKIELQAKYDREIENLKNDLRLIAYRDEVRFARHHEKQITLIELLSSRLHGVRTAIQGMALFGEFKRRGADIDLAKQGFDRMLDSFFDEVTRNRIYLPPELLTRLDSLEETLRRILQHSADKGDLTAAIERLRSALPGDCDRIEDDFRKLVSVSNGPVFSRVRDLPDS